MPTHIVNYSRKVQNMEAKKLGMQVLLVIGTQLLTVAVALLTGARERAGVASDSIEDIANNVKNYIKK
jgi:hypothetical protein